MVELEFYKSHNNSYRDEVIEMMDEYNEEFSEFDDTIEENAKNYLIYDEKKRRNTSKREALEIYHDSSDYVIIALKENGIVGFRFVGRPEKFEDAGDLRQSIPKEFHPTIRLTLAIVRKEYRGERIWSKMVEKVEEKLSKEFSESKSMSLFTTELNEPMQRAAKKKEFEKVSVIENERGENIDLVAYAKKV